MPDPLLFDRDTPMLNRTFELLSQSSHLAEQTYERIKQARLLLAPPSLGRRVSRDDGRAVVPAP